MSLSNHLKLLTHTDFVRYTQYRTPLFGPEYWVDKDHSFQEEVERLTASQPAQHRSLFKKLAMQVDKLESDISQRESLKKDLGLVVGTDGIAMQDLNHKVAYPFLVTVLLDRFLFACSVFGDNIRTVKESYPHPITPVKTALSLTDWDTPKLEAVIRKFVTDCGIGMQENPSMNSGWEANLLNDEQFLQNGMDAPETAPTPSVSVALTTEERQRLVQQEAIKLGAPIITLVRSHQHFSTSQLHLVLANCGVLAASAMFLIHTEAGKPFTQNFLKFLSQMEMNDGTRGFIKDFVCGKQGKDKQLLHQIGPIAISLATTPFFILDQFNDLSVLKGHITLKQMISLSLRDAVINTKEILEMERVIYQCILNTSASMFEVVGDSSESTTPLAASRIPGLDIDENEFRASILRCSTPENRLSIIRWEKKDIPASLPANSGAKATMELITPPCLPPPFIPSPPPITPLVQSLVSIPSFLPHERDAMEISEPETELTKDRVHSSTMDEEDASGDERAVENAMVQTQNTGDGGLNDLKLIIAKETIDGVSEQQTKPRTQNRTSAILPIPNVSETRGCTTRWKSPVNYSKHMGGSSTTKTKKNVRKRGRDDDSDGNDNIPDSKKANKSTERYEFIDVILLDFGHLEVEEIDPEGDEIQLTTITVKCKRVIYPAIGGISLQDIEFEVPFPVGCEGDLELVKRLQKVQRHSGTGLIRSISIEPSISEMYSMSAMVTSETSIPDPQHNGDVFPISVFSAINDPDINDKNSIQAVRKFQASHSFLVVKPFSVDRTDQDYKQFNIDLEKMADEGMNPRIVYSASNLRNRELARRDSELLYVKTSFEEVIKRNLKAFNFLDIPYMTLPHPEFIRKISIETVAAFQCKQGFPIGSTRWALGATEGALSRAHVDAAGFNTYVIMRQGVKIWWIAVPKVDEVGNLIPLRGSLHNLKIEDYEWVRYVLEPGSILVMQPGTIHVVLSATACVAVGGHFYTPDTLWLTMHSRRNEHQFGDENTNTQHVGGESLLHGLVAEYHSNILRKYPGLLLFPPIAPSTEEILKVIENCAPLKDFAALCFMVVHPEAFEPAIVDDTKYACPTAMLSLRERSLPQVVFLLRFSPELLKEFKAIYKLPAFKAVPQIPSL